MQIFAQIPQEHPIIERLENDFENHVLFWHTANDFLRIYPNWMDGPFTLIDPEELLNNMDKWVRSSARCAKLLTKAPKMAAEELRQRILDFNVSYNMKEFDLLDFQLFYNFHLKYIVNTLHF